MCVVCFDKCDTDENDSYVKWLVSMMVIVMVMVIPQAVGLVLLIVVSREVVSINLTAINS